MADPPSIPPNSSASGARRWALKCWRSPPGRCCPASQRYHTGVMFDHLACGNGDSGAHAFSKRAVLFSGLWGLLRRAADLRYKLKMERVAARK
ncbi:MAG: hypothetical protein R2838_04790 [Caldilineaceae bacterium]